MIAVVSVYLRLNLVYLRHGNDLWRMTLVNGQWFVTPLNMNGASEAPHTERFIETATHALAVAKLTGDEG